MPTAVSLPPGSGQAAVGAVVTGGETPGGAVTLRGAVGITDRLAISGGLMEPLGGLFLGLRYNVVQTERFRLAPFVFGIADDDLVTVVPADASEALSAGIGVALEGGGETFRFDLSLPLVTTAVNPLVDPLYVPWAGSSFGVSMRLGERHGLRFGVESFFSPAVTWRYAPERWYVQGAAMWSLVRLEPMLAAEVGLRF
ncbi:MAG: hypothetical protein Q8P18_27245 [Pseudomonadota bacterium]|nr:hypothetical protein [Pseudomonadota bacterium]